jgi:acetyl esterase/lipase
LAPEIRLHGDAAPAANLATETYRLWSGRAPNSLGETVSETPTVTIFRPQFPGANAAAVVIAPGGAYVGLASRLEGIEPAAWFTARGLTAFVLTYRTGSSARLPTPLLDGARAIRFVRAHAADFAIDPSRIGMMGFSAGGHLAATTSVDATTGRADAPDPIERFSSRPDFLILGYPWLEGTQLQSSGTSQYCDFANHFGGPSCKSGDFVGFAPLAHVSDKAPPTFIYHTTNDELVSVAGSIRFYEALIAHGVPAEFHGFEAGRHGTGLGGSSPALSLWPELLDRWLRGRGLIDPPPTLPKTTPGSRLEEPASTPRK